jgi:hypothetical protein
MKAFEVIINGHHLCRIGVGDDGVLTTIVTWVGGKGREGHFHFHVGGLDNTTDEHVSWPEPTIGVGTEITVRVVEAATVDPPTKRTPRGGTDAKEEAQ